MGKGHELAILFFLFWKRSVFIPIPKKGKAKECSNYCTIALISHTSKVMLKVLQARLQQYMNCELPGVQAGFRKGKGTTDQIANICWIIEKARDFQKNIYFCFIDYAKAFDHVDHNKLENSSRDGNTRPLYLPPTKITVFIRMNPSLIPHLGSTSVITAWCHLEEGERWELFLQPDLCKGQVPELSIDDKMQCPSNV